MSYLIADILYKLKCSPQTKQPLNTWLITSSDAFIDKERENDGPYVSRQLIEQTRCMSQLLYLSDGTSHLNFTLALAFPLWTHFIYFRMY